MGEKAKRFFKSPFGIGCCCLLGALVMSWGAQLVNTSGYSYSVKSGVADMDAFYTEEYKDALVKPFRLTIGDKKDGMVEAKMAYDLYLPRGASADHPVPAIALTHGYLNSKEFESGVAIELARRGYAVMTYDQYDHGDSTWKTPSQFNFYAWSAYDAMEYLASQPYVLKAKDGTAMVGLSGHSMGGFSSELAVGWDELNIRMGVYSAPKAVTMLAQGADFRYIDFYTSGYGAALGMNIEHTYQLYGARTTGTLGARYDEFFFDNSDKPKGNVIEKDYAKDKVGYSMLGLTSAGESNKFYQVDPVTNTALKTENADPAGNYGERIIYKVAGDHPYNTWSPEATGHIVDFFNHGFTHQLARKGLGTLADHNVKAKAGSHQTWWLKEVFTCLGLIALMGAVLFLISGLFTLPFFNKVKTDGSLVAEVKPTTAPRKGIGIALTVFSILLSGFMIPALMSPRSDSSAASITLLTKIVDVMMYSGFGIGVLLGIIAAVFKNKDEAKEKNFLHAMTGGFVIAVLGLLLHWLLNDGTNYVLASTNRYFNAPSINTIAYWAMASGLLALLFALVSHYFVNPERKREHLGLKASWSQVGIAALSAIIVCGFICAFVWLTKAIFHTDYRVYTYAVKTVNGPAFVSALRYLPFFFIFYLCAGISIAVATAGKKGWKADLLAVLIEVAPTALFLIYQYGILYTTGTAPFVHADLNSILAQGLVITLIGLAIYQRRTLEQTNNIWSGVFLNTIFFTFITLANTTVYNLA